MYHALLARSSNHVLKSCFSFYDYSFYFTEACCMAFTPQSSPTRVSRESVGLSYLLINGFDRGFKIIATSPLQTNFTPSKSFYLDSKEFVVRPRSQCLFKVIGLMTWIGNVLFCTLLLSDNFGNWAKLQDWTWCSIM